jgi:aspartyl protease/tetratricopeptide repeat protein
VRFPLRRPRPPVATVALLAALGCGAAIAVVREPARAGEVEIEPADRALGRLDSLQAIVRAEEARVRVSLGIEANWTRLARAWFQVGDHGKAAKCLERARSIGAREFDTALLSGRIARCEGRFGEAIEWLDRAARMRPDDWEVHEDLGLALYLDGRLSRAADHWERARQLPGSGSPDRTGLIGAMRRAGEHPYEVSGRGRERIGFTPPTSRGPFTVPVRINGRGPYPFRIDAGSPEVTLTRALADQLGLETIAGGGEGPSGAAAGVAYATIDSLTLGATTLRRMPVAVTWAQHPDDRRGEVAGRLGFEALRRFRFCVDPVEHALWLEPLPPAGTPPDTARPAWAPAGAVAHRVPIVLRGTHLLVAYGRVNQGPERPFLLDVGGSGVALAAPASTLAEAKVAMDTTRVLTGSSASGSVRFLGVPIARLCVDGACRDSLDGGYGTFPARLELNPSFRLAGIVSGGFLFRYRVGVDLARREAWLIER